MPEKIGSYTVVSKLGRGGMGVVYKGRDESLNRFVAIKVLTENLSDDPTFLQRFVREAQAAASLSHPNIVQIYFTGQDEAGHPYFVMEYVSGQSLEQLLRFEGRIDNPRASQLILQAAHGLAAAHDRGIIHRDIKPANLILDDRGILKIADFGLAVPPDAETQLTATGMMVGTPGYFSPEQFDGTKADPLTDIYALGVTYYMLLTGTPPFRGESPLALMKQIVDANPPDVTAVNPNVDPESRRILGRMIAKDRSQRYQNCHELVADLENLLGTMGVRSATSGLARTPMSPATQEAMSTPTVITAREGTQPAIPPTAAIMPAAITSPGAPMTAAPAAITSPGTPMVAAPTDPAIAMPAKKRSSSLVLLAALFVLVLLAGGAFAGLWYGTSFLRHAVAAVTARKATTQPVAASSSSNGSSNRPSKSPSTPSLNDRLNPPHEVLLSQTITPTLPADGVGQSASAVPAENHDEQTKPAPGQTGVSESTRQTAAKLNAPRGGAKSDARAATSDLPRTAQTAATPAPARRALSGVAVASIGDRALIGAVSSVLRNEAEAAGLKAVDAHDLPSTEEMLHGRPAVRDLIARLRDDGYAVLMLARIEPTGERELSYYGRHDTAYSARVTVAAYDLATGRPIGAPGSGEITYTSINIESESQDVVTPLARECARTIRNR